MRLRLTVWAVVVVCLLGAVQRASADQVFTYAINSPSIFGGNLTGDFVVSGVAGDPFFDSSLLSVSLNYSNPYFPIDQSWGLADYDISDSVLSSPETDFSGNLGDPLLTPLDTGDQLVFVNSSDLVLVLGFTSGFPNWLTGLNEPIDGGSWDLTLEPNAATPLPASLSLGAAGMTGLALVMVARRKLKAA
jgi:hypothetical protein